jgi:4-hydroxythreonine-4-phosphate dehydrogenase
LLNYKKKSLPNLGITTGDPAGIGPEISLRAAQENALAGKCRLVLFGSYAILESRAVDLDLPFDFERIPIDSFREKTRLPDRCIVDIHESDVRPGIGSAVTGRAAARNILECHAACSRGQLDAMVTAPLNKKCLQDAGYDYPGHTEFLARLSGVSEFAMGFLTDKLKVVLATIHLPLQSVAERISSDLILRKIRLTLSEFPRLGLPCGKIAVAGLNPHAGESGILGAEEESHIAPAIRHALQEFPGRRIFGPLPGDTLFWRAYNGEFDVVLAMYHDQGLAPIKLIGFGEAVNVTLGLPFVRTSVDHGTAYDIAGKGFARHDGMMTAIRWAMQLSAARKKFHTMQ